VVARHDIPTGCIICDELLARMMLDSSVGGGWGGGDVVVADAGAAGAGGRDGARGEVFEIWQFGFLVYLQLNIGL
jgi:hypothetical protein